MGKETEGNQSKILTIHFLDSELPITLDMANKQDVQLYLEFEEQYDVVWTTSNSIKVNNKSSEDITDRFERVDFSNLPALFSPDDEIYKFEKEQFYHDAIASLRPILRDLFSLDGAPLSDQMMKIAYGWTDNEVKKLRYEANDVIEKYVDDCLLESHFFPNLSSDIEEKIFRHLLSVNPIPNNRFRISERYGSITPVHARIIVEDVMERFEDKPVYEVLEKKIGYFLS